MYNAMQSNGILLPTIQTNQFTLYKPIDTEVGHSQCSLQFLSGSFTSPYQRQDCHFYMVMQAMGSSRNSPYSPHGRFCCFAPPHPPPLPPANSRLFSYIASTNVAFKTPLPLGILNDLPWGGYGFFLELYNVQA